MAPAEARGIRGRRRLSSHRSKAQPAIGRRYLLDLGSTAGGLGAVRVNDGPPRGFDTSHPQVEITDDLRPGDNTLLVRVASSLNNRLLARGYYDSVLDLIGSLILDGPPRTQKTQPHAHGLLGPVRVLRETSAG
jgi:hypothetical protein